MRIQGFVFSFYKIPLVLAYVSRMVLRFRYILALLKYSLSAISSQSNSACPHRISKISRCSSVKLSRKDSTVSLKSSRFLSGTSVLSLMTVLSVGLLIPPARLPTMSSPLLDISSALLAQIALSIFLNLNSSWSKL